MFLHLGFPALTGCSLQAKEAETNHVKQVPTSMFFAHNTALGPPYHVLIDTNFINFSIKVSVSSLLLGEEGREVLASRCLRDRVMMRHVSMSQHRMKRACSWPRG